MRNPLARLMAISILSIMLMDCGDTHPLLVDRRFLMDTVVEITVADRDLTRAKKVIEKAFDEIKRIEAFAGPLKGDQLKALNMNASKGPVIVSKELFGIISRSIQYSQLTQGAFDISVTPVLELWGFLGRQTQLAIPKADHLQRALKLVNYHHIALNQHAHSILFESKGMKLTLGGIAKGYAVSRAVSVLKEHGIQNAIVNAGGDIHVIGNKYGKPWKIGIRHPRTPGKMLTEIEAEGNKSIFTSGDYERYFVVDGKRYHHIINPATGFPANSKCVSVTIVSDDPVEADALATAAFVLGPEKGLDLIERRPHAEAIMVLEDENGLSIKRSSNLIGK